MSWCDYLSSASCIRIHPMTSEVQSIFNFFGLLRSYIAKNGDNTTLYSNDSDIVIKYDVQDGVGIGFWKWSLQRFWSSFCLISKYGAYFK